MARDDENKPRSPLRTSPGLNPPRHPAAEPEQTPPPGRFTVQERRDSFPAFDANDRMLLENVLRTAKQALDESRAAAQREERERTALEGKMTARIGDLEAEVAEIRAAVAEMRGISGDVRGLRGDIATLNGTVMANLAADATRERRMGELELKVERIGHDAGRDAGKSSGARWGTIAGAIVSVISGIVYLIAYVTSLHDGAEPPKPPAALPPPAPSVKWP